MKCTNCGYEFEKGIKFCPKCGTKTDEAAPAPTEPLNNDVYPIEEIAADTPVPDAPKKKSRTPIIIAAVLAVLIIIGCVVLAVLFFGGDKADEPESTSTEAAETTDPASKDETQINAIISEADDLADSENYETALQNVENALAIYPDSQALKDKVEEYKASIAAKEKQDNLDSAKALADEGKYIDAMSLLEQLLAEGDDADYQAAYDEYRETYRQNKLTEAENHYKGNDNMSAYNTIMDAINNLGEDEELTEKAELYEQTYVKNIISQADTLVDEGKYDDAKELLDKAIGNLPDNTTLSDKKTELAEYKSAGLDTLTPVNGGFTWNDGDAKDIFGNTYENAANYAVMHGDGSYCKRENTYSAEYNVAKEYDTLDLKITPYSDFGQSAKTYIRIYVDSVLRYTSPFITQKTQPFSIPTVDISNAEYVKIVVKVGGYGCVILSDAVLSSSPDFVSDLDDSQTSLSELETFNGSISWQNEYPVSSVTCDYTTAKNYTTLHGDGTNCKYYTTHSMEYYVNKQYKDISFNLAPEDDYNEDAKTVVKIYVDDKLVYTSKEITQKTARFNTGKIDISNAQYVKIVAEVDSHGCIILSDALLTNK